jgi:hypothetical protein
LFKILLLNCFYYIYTYVRADVVATFVLLITYLYKCMYVGKHIFFQNNRSSGTK